MLEAILVAAVIILDQWVKHLTDIHLMPLGTSVPLWEGVFHFTSTHNTGAAFGMLAGGRWLFLVLSVTACAGIIYVLVKFHKRLHILLRVCLALILAGAVGNLIDRVLLGYVRDMFDFRLIHFAIFNVADSAVSVGAVLFMLDLLFGKGKTLIDDLEAERLVKAGKVAGAAPEDPQKTKESPKEEQAEEVPNVEEEQAGASGQEHVIKEPNGAS